MKLYLSVIVHTLETAACANSPSADGGKPSMSFLSVINFSNFFVASKTFSENLWESFSSSCIGKRQFKYADDI